MLITKINEAKSIAPMSCTVFLSNIVVCLEGDIGLDAWSIVQKRGVSRFGWVDYWINGCLHKENSISMAVDEENTLEDQVEKCDLFIIVGRPDKVLPYSNVAKKSKVMTLLITVTEGDDISYLKNQWSTQRTVFIDLQPGLEVGSRAGLVLDSLVGLFNYYEKGLVRFNMYDLRTIWLDGADLGVEYHKAKLEVLNENGEIHLINHNSFCFTKIESKQNLNSILVVVRGEEDLSEEKIIAAVQTLSAGREGIAGIHWYFIEAQLPAKCLESIVFLCPL